MTPEETLDWLAQQHFDQCREERPIQDWMRKMKSQLPAQPEHEFVRGECVKCGASIERQEPVVFLSEWSDWRNMVVQNLMRHGNIDKDFARRLAHYYQDMTPQRDSSATPLTWVGLTDEEKQEWIDAMPYDPQPRHCMILVNVMEAKLKAKNERLEKNT